MPINPMVGLQPPNMTWQQGNLLSPQTGVLQGPQQGLLSSMGPWSQLAYNLAGKPNQGAYAPVAAPTAIPGSLSSGTSGASAGSTAGALAGGLLGAVARNPALIKSAANGISGLLGSGTAAAPGMSAASGPVGMFDYGAGASGSGVTGGATAYGTDAGVAPASALSGTGDAATGGLLGAGSGAAVGSSAAGIGAGAPGVFASGNAAAGSAGASSTLSGAGAVAAPAAFAALAAYIGSQGMAAQKQNDQGNALYKSWLTDSGSTSKIVNPPTAKQAADTAQGGFAAVGSGYHPKSVVYDKSGKPMSDAQVQLAMLNYAKAKGLPTGNFNLTAEQLQQIINSGGYGSQVYGG